MKIIHISGMSRDPNDYRVDAESPWLIYPDGPLGELYVKDDGSAFHDGSHVRIYPAGSLLMPWEALASEDEDAWGECGYCDCYSDPNSSNGHSSECPWVTDLLLEGED